jgi:hypothetical protein
VSIVRALEELPWAVGMTVGTSVSLLCCLSPDHYGLCQPAQNARDTSGMFITVNIVVMNRVAMRVEETVGKHSGDDVCQLDGGGVDPWEFFPQPRRVLLHVNR